MYLGRKSMRNKPAVCLPFQTNSTPHFAVGDLAHRCLDVSTSTKLTSNEDKEQHNCFELVAIHTLPHLAVGDLVERSSNVEAFSDLAPLTPFERVDAAPLHGATGYLCPGHRIPEGCQKRPGKLGVIA